MCRVYAAHTAFLSGCEGASQWMKVGTTTTFGLLTLFPLPKKSCPKGIKGSLLSKHHQTILPALLNALFKYSTSVRFKMLPFFICNLFKSISRMQDLTHSVLLKSLPWKKVLGWEGGSNTFFGPQMVVRKTKSLMNEVFKFGSKGKKCNSILKRIALIFKFGRRNGISGYLGLNLEIIFCGGFSLELKNPFLYDTVMRKVV